MTCPDRQYYNVRMQQLAGETIMPPSLSECAEQLLEVTPLIMRRIRAEMRRRTMPGLSVPQFRALNYLRQHPGASLNVVAEHLGLTPPTASKLIQKLVADRVVARRVASDRRRVCLSLTHSGITALSAARGGDPPAARGWPQVSRQRGAGRFAGCPARSGAGILTRW